MEEKEINIHGFIIKYSETCAEGIKYLQYDLQFREAKTLTDAARFAGTAEFEDDQDRDWTLIYEKDTGKYKLVKRNWE